MSPFPQTERTRLRRIPKRGFFDRETIYPIIDEAFVCNVATTVEGHLRMIPTAHWRHGDRFYIHGAKASKLLKALAAGTDACVNVTLVDGLVLARSAFHHSMNYRSVVLFGKAQVVTDEAAKMASLEHFVERVFPGRWSEVRPPNPKEMAATSVLYFDMAEVSAKVRTGPPVDDDEDHALDTWAGVLPLQLQAGALIDDPLLRMGIAAPNADEILQQRQANFGVD
jgi:hypothetical protein